MLCAEKLPGGLEHIHVHTGLILRINFLMMLLLLLQLLGNGSSSSSGEQSSGDQELWVRWEPGTPRAARPRQILLQPSKWKVCLFLGYRLSGRKDGHCQGFYWIPVKGIERVSCLLSFPAPAVVKEVFYL